MKLYGRFVVYICKSKKMSPTRSKIRMRKQVKSPRFYTKQDVERMHTIMEQAQKQNRLFNRCIEIVFHSNNQLKQVTTCRLNTSESNVVTDSGELISYQNIDAVFIV